MSKIRFVSLFVLLALLLSAVPGAVMGQEPPPPEQEVVIQGGGEESKVISMRNRADPNYVYTAEELKALAVKDRLAEQHMQELEATKGAGYKFLSVGTWLEPNNWAHRNYCGPAATQVALDARLPASQVPDIDTIGEEESIDPNWGIWISAIKPVLNTRLNTDWYWYGSSGSEQTLFNRIVWNIDHNYALVTGCKTGLMKGWDRNVGHIVAVPGYYNGTNDDVRGTFYTETSGSVAGYTGSYWQHATKFDMWQYVEDNNAQVW